MKYQCTKERFLKDIEKHEMKIIKDEGVYRHIRFGRPESGTYCFNLLTWPRHLCITGDMGTWVFSRVEDMFDFFIMSENDFNKENIINPYYWAEKVLSVSKFGGPIKEFSAECFRKEIEDYLFYDFHDREKKEEVWEEIEDQILSYVEDENPQLLYSRVYEFESETGFTFEDFYPDGLIYTHHYIWICYAIVWGIIKYKNKK